MIALLTGAPGVGETTVARRLAMLHPDSVEVVSFGKLIYTSVSDRIHLPYSQFRTTAAQVVTPTDLAAATAELTTRTAAARTSPRWLLVESHAVAREGFGWQAYPDSPATLSGYAYDRVLHLEAPAHTILFRTRSHHGGRLAHDERDVEVLATIQMAVSVFYSAVLGIALDVIDAAGSLEGVVGTVESLLDLGPR